MESACGKIPLSRRKKILSSLFFISIFTWQCAFSGESVSTDKKQDAVLRFKLEARDSYVLGQPVPVTFRLENLTHKDVYVLTWYTPFEGLKGKIFKVTRDGAEIPYEGRMIKRGEPAHEDYLHIVAGGAASAVVDLNQAYKIDVPGEYHVEFVRRIYDFTFSEKTIPRTQAEHQGVAISGNAVTFRIIGP